MQDKNNSNELVQQQQAALFSVTGGNLFHAQKIQSRMAEFKRVDIQTHLFKR